MSVDLTVERQTASTGKLLFLLLGILLAGANMRAAIASVGPLTGFIREDFGLSNGAMGWMTTIPLIGFALLSPFAPSIARRFGIERTLIASLLVMTIGIAVRVMSSVPMLFIGTAAVGVAIAICNVLLPSIVKKNFANRVGMMTGLYSMTMTIFASIAASVSVPLAQGAGWGWRNALLVWAGMSLVGFMAWLPMARFGKVGAKSVVSAAPGQQSNVWKSGLAWKITFFMGFQSFNFYVCVAWLPDILISKGWSSESAGYMLSLMQLSGIPFNFLIPTIAERMKDQKLVAVGGATVSLIGYAGLFTNSTATLTASIVLIGMGQGVCISLALMFIAMRAKNATQAASLSGMVQSMGYTLAALGPICLGILHDAVGSWTWPIAALMCSAGTMIFSGYGSGRNRHVE
ncbi:CynX/NimT family MFS transporter [Cohnella terricola]|uniref:MFS transporter n=1 Tax=Cohnella terricola TaxID=1289167 RepID=A0A559JAK8_9BACL|nr:MFS transporter [Cohnella terricola]TVX96893.1 MFS transporter [Cohnella terricola]